MSLLMTDSPLRGGLRPSAHKPLVQAPLLPETDRANWLFKLGSQALKDGLWAVARGCFRSCIHHYGDCMEARYNLALCELATGQPREALAHLAPLPDRAAVQAWYAELQHSSRHYHLAIMHQTLGFCGVIGGNLDDELGWLYIWVGTDCQQQGLAPRALNLVRQQLQQAGVEQILTAVWPDNLASRKALQRGGFEPLNAQGQAGADPVQLWHSPLHETAHWPISDAQLQERIDRLGAGFDIVPGNPA